MIKFCEIHAHASDSKHSVYLDAAMNQGNVAILKYTSDHLIGKNIETKWSLVKDAGGTGATMKLAKCKLDDFAMVKSYSGLVNDEKLLK